MIPITTSRKNRFKIRSREGEGKMNRLKALRITGFKKFQSLTIEFNEHINILVGENEAGKSTILDAI
ncbi:MAG: AAA family ATPase, partial [Acidaminococcaceae bacterium]|nr:AAA family ATPase [Acidaminococcaceae bacterium]